VKVRLTLLTASNSKRRAAIGFIVCLGIVSLFADMTYEGAHSIISPFLLSLGATAVQVAFIAGLGEMLGQSLRYFSGRLANRTHAYWAITFLGYAMNVIAVPALAFAGDWRMVAILVVAERTGKAFRGPARDVLLSEATQEVGHGFGFGLHSIMDQTGAVVGPLLMWIGVMRTGHFQSAFLWLGVPALGTLAALTTARFLYPTQGASARNPNPQAIPRIFWLYTVAAGLLAFGFVDWPLLVYRFAQANLTTSAEIPLLYAVAMGIEGAMAFVLGRMFDRYGIAILVVGTLVSILSLPLGFLGGRAAALASVGCWATGVGAQDACLRSGISQVVSMNKRGSAFGSFNGVWGICWFAGTWAMGLLYSHSLFALVVLGVVTQLASAIMFWWLRPQLPSPKEV
jgi:Major Facilitator Superfamily